MIWFRERVGRAEFAFSNAEIDLGRSPEGEALENRRRLGHELGAQRVVAMHQVHGSDVAVVGDAPQSDDVNVADLSSVDAMVTAVAGVGLLVRVADCAPIVLIGDDGSCAGVIHAGREGLVSGVVPAGVQALRGLGASRIRAWVGPRACARCYEVPAEMADQVDRQVPGTRSQTRHGTASIDIGAGICGQLRDLDVDVVDLGEHACTIEDTQFFSHRRHDQGRMGAMVVLT